MTKYQFEFLFMYKRTICWIFLSDFLRIETSNKVCLVSLELLAARSFLSSFVTRALPCDLIVNIFYKHKNHMADC